MVDFSDYVLESKASLNAFANVIKEKSGVSDNMSVGQMAECVNSNLITAKIIDRSVTEFEIPYGITKIGNCLFRDCQGLKKLTIPDTVTEIDNAAFYMCLCLTNITIPDSVASIGTSVFYNCKAITEITIPDGVTSIKDNTFGHCSGLKEITIPDSVTSIGVHAFYGCTSLRKATIGGGVISIDKTSPGIFGGCTALTDIYVPFTEDDELAKNAPWGAVNAEVHYFKIYSEGLAYALSSDESYYIVTGIGECTDTNLIFPTIYNNKPVKGIGEEAFKGNTSITAITIPESITMLGKDAFMNCSGLNEVHINANIVSDINGNPIDYDTWVFDGAGSSGSAVYFGENVTHIPNYLLGGSDRFSINPPPEGWQPDVPPMCYQFSSITVGKNVTSIGAYAFFNFYVPVDIYVPFAEGTIDDSPWGAMNGNVHYDSEV